MGFCSSCRDISDQIEFSLFPEEDDLVNGTDCDWNDVPNVNISVRSQVWSPYPLVLPLHGPRVIDFWSFGEWYYPTEVNITSGDAFIHAPSNQMQEIMILEGRQPPWKSGQWDSIPQLASSNHNCTNTAKSIDWGCRGYGAASCLLYPCVKSLSASVTNGKYVEELISNSKLEEVYDLPYDSTWQLISLGLPFTFIDTKCLTPEQRGNLGSKGLDISFLNAPIWHENTSYAPQHQIISDHGKRWVWSNTTWNRTNPGLPKNKSYPWSMIADGCVYLYDSTAYFAREGASSRPTLKDSFAGALVAEKGATSGLLNSVSGPSGLQGFQSHVFSGENMTFDLVTQGFDNISTLMTNYLRVNGNADFSESAKGTASHYAVCLEVQFKWLAFPVILLVVTIVLLAWTVLLTSKHAVPTWKTLPLAYVFHGPGGPRAGLSRDGNRPEEENGQDLTPPTASETIAGMEKGAKQVTVQLMQADGDTYLRSFRPDISETRRTRHIRQDKQHTRWIETLERDSLEQAGEDIELAHDPQLDRSEQQRPSAELSTA